MLRIASNGLPCSGYRAGRNVCSPQQNHLGKCTKTLLCRQRARLDHTLQGASTLAGRNHSKLPDPVASTPCSRRECTTTLSNDQSTAVGASV